MSVPALAFPALLDGITAFGEVRNNAVTALTADILAADVVIPVGSTAAFASTGFITLGDGTATTEIICYGGKTASSFTGVVRAQDGTTAKDFSSGTRVDQRTIALDKNILRDAIRNMQANVGVGAQGTDVTIAARLARIETLISGAATLVSAFDVLDDADKGGADPAGPADGQTHIVNNWLGATLYVGTHAGSPILDGDLAEFNTTLAGWVRIVPNSVGFLPGGTRIVVTSAGAAGSLLTHDDEIATADGAGGFTFAVPTNGQQVIVVGEEEQQEHFRWIWDSTPGAWVSIPPVGSISVLTTRGDLWHRDTLNIDAPLAIGAADRVMVSDGTDPSWGQVDLSTTAVVGTLPIPRGGTGQTTVQAAMDALSQVATRGDLLVADAVPNLVILALGAANRLLRSDGTDAVWAQVGLTTDVTGVLPIANGGTSAATAQAALNALAGFTTRGDLLVENAAGDAVRLALGAASRILRSDGSDPVWGQLVLTTDVTGILPIANGGTSGATAQAAINAIAGFTTRGDLLVEDVTGDAVRLALGAAARVLRSDGSDPAWAQVALATDITGTLPVANGGTGQTTQQAAIDALSLLATRGDILVADSGVNAVPLALGASGEVLVSDGSDAVWGDVPIANVDSSAVAAGIPLQSDGSNPVGGETDAYISQAGPFAAAIAPVGNFITALVSFGALGAGMYVFIVNGFIDLPAGSTPADIEVALVDSAALANPLAGTFPAIVEDQAANLPHKVGFVIFVKVAIAALTIFVRARVVAAAPPAAWTFNNITGQARLVG